MPEALPQKLEHLPQKDANLKPLRLMLIWPLFKSYFVFLILVAVFNAYEYGGLALLVSYGVFFFTVPVIALIVLLTALFPRFLFRWHKVYCIAVPVVLAPLMGWMFWGQNAPILSTVLIAILTLPTASIYFIHQERKPFRTTSTTGA